MYPPYVNFFYRPDWNTHPSLDDEVQKALKKKLQIRIDIDNRDIFVRAAGGLIQLTPNKEFVEIFLLGEAPEVMDAYSVYLDSDFLDDIPDENRRDFVADNLPQDWEYQFHVPRKYPFTQEFLTILYHSISEGMDYNWEVATRHLHYSPQEGALQNEKNQLGHLALSDFSKSISTGTKAPNWVMPYCGELLSVQFDLARFQYQDYLIVLDTILEWVEIEWVYRNSSIAELHPTYNLLQRTKTVLAQFLDNPHNEETIGRIVWLSNHISQVINSIRAAEEQQTVLTLDPRLRDARDSLLKVLQSITMNLNMLTQQTEDLPYTLRIWLNQYSPGFLQEKIWAVFTRRVAERIAFRHPIL